MFLSVLSTPQREVFFSLASSLIAADGDVDPRERAALALLAQEAGQTLTQPEAAPWGELRAQLDTPQSRSAVLIELLGLAHADMQFCSAERHFIDGVAAALGVSEEQLAVLESWVVRQLSLAAEGRALLEVC